MALSFIIIGIIITLIPSLFYISSLTKDDIAPLPYIPNYIGYPKPKYIQVLKTQEEVDSIKKSSVRDAEIAEIGSALKLGRTGLNLWPQEEVNAPNYHAKYIGPQLDKVKEIDGVKFIPNTYLERDTMLLQILLTETSVEAAKKIKTLNNKDLLEVGSAITCPSPRCFVTSKTTIETEYKKVVPISEL